MHYFLTAYVAYQFKAALNEEGSFATLRSEEGRGTQKQVKERAVEREERDHSNATKRTHARLGLNAYIHVFLRMGYQRHRRSHSLVLGSPPTHRTRKSNMKGEEAIQMVVQKKKRNETNNPKHTKTSPLLLLFDPSLCDAQADGITTYTLAEREKRWVTLSQSLNCLFDGS